MKLPKRPVGILRGDLTFPESLSEDLEKELKARFTMDNPAFETASKYSPWGASRTLSEKLEFWWTDEDERFCVHRGLDPSKLMVDNQKEFKRIQWTDARTYFPVRFPKPLLSPNEEQQEMLAAFEDHLVNNRRPFGAYLLIGSTSVGKTILQALAARRLGQRAIILCPTDLIVTTWYDDLKKLFGLSEHKIGLIKQSTWRIGEQFTIASAKTLIKRKDRWEQLNKLFGTVVVDETQNVSASYFFDFVSQSPAAYRIGATATESSNGKVNPQLAALFGVPVVRTDTYGKETASSMSIKDAKTIDTEFTYEHQRDNLDWHDFALAMACDDDRNQLIAHHVRDDWECGRVPLVVTKTREHLNVLLEVLREKGLKPKEISGSTNADKKRTKKLLAAIISGKVRVIVATVAAVKEGANIPPLDCLHVAMPVVSPGNLEQLLGRIRRKHPGKKYASVRYYLDVRMSYAMRVYKRTAVPVLRKMKVPGYANLFIC